MRKMEENISCKRKNKIYLVTKLIYCKMGKGRYSKVLVFQEIKLNAAYLEKQFQPVAKNPRNNCKPRKIRNFYH